MPSLRHLQNERYMIDSLLKLNLLHKQEMKRSSGFAQVNLLSTRQSVTREQMPIMRYLSFWKGLDWTLFLGVTWLCKTENSVSRVQVQKSLNITLFQKRTPAYHPSKILSCTLMSDALGLCWAAFWNNCTFCNKHPKCNNFFISFCNEAACCNKLPHHIL